MAVADTTERHAAGGRPLTKLGSPDTPRACWCGRCTCSAHAVQTLLLHAAFVVECENNLVLAVWHRVFTAKFPVSILCSRPCQDTSAVPSPFRLPSETCADAPWPKGRRPAQPHRTIWGALVLWSLPAVTYWTGSDTCGPERRRCGGVVVGGGGGRESKSDVVCGLVDPSLRVVCGLGGVCGGGRGYCVVNGGVGGYPPPPQPGTAGGGGGRSTSSAAWDSINPLILY